MDAMWRADFSAWKDREEQRGEQPPGWQIAAREEEVARWHANVEQHVWALQRVLAMRVLRRHYPDGWGRGISPG
jgi:hypothetical protein